MQAGIIKVPLLHDLPIVGESVFTNRWPMFLLLIVIPLSWYLVNRTRWGLLVRAATEDREMWNTYGPTEATVVACAQRMLPGQPVSIGLPLNGWDLVVVGKHGAPVALGEVGELVIGGVGLASYLDPVKDAEKYAPLESLGWERAYRSGDLVVFDPAGLLFVGRADDQVKLGGRRIELGEVDAALQALPGVQGGAAAVQTTPAGHQILVGYLVPSGVPEDLDLEAAGTALK